MGVVRARSNESAWFTETNPRLRLAEIGLEFDTGKFKMGDGHTKWNDLSYVGDNGGSQPVKVVRFPIAYNTPGITTTGVEVYTPTPGEIIMLNASVVRIMTAWDGDSPTLNMDSEGGSWGSILSSGGLATADTPGPNWTNIGGTQSGAIYLSDDTPLVAKIDDGGGGDPESTQGEAEIVFLIVAAA